MKNKKDGIKRIMGICKQTLNQENRTEEEKALAKMIKNIIENYNLDKTDFVNNQVILKTNNLSEEEIRDIAEKVLEISEQRAGTLSRAVTKQK